MARSNCATCCAIGQRWPSTYRQKTLCGDGLYASLLAEPLMLSCIRRLEAPGRATVPAVSLKDDLRFLFVPAGWGRARMQHVDSTNYGRRLFLKCTKSLIF